MKIKNNLPVRVLFLLECLLVSVIPAVATVTLLRTVLHKDIRQFVPNLFNDQVYYWHEIDTFRTVGLNGGYYAPDEQIPPFSLSHSDAVGPFFTLIYAGIARITGWENGTPILINVSLLGLGILAFIGLARLNPVQVALTGLLCLTFFPLLLYTPSIFQESFHQAGALVLAGLFYRLLAERRSRWWVSAACFTLLVILSLVRISWAMFFVPFFVLILPRKWKYLPLAVGLALLVGFALFSVVGAVSAPSNNSVTRVLGGFRVSLLSGLRATYHQIRGNLALSREIITPDRLVFYQQIVYLAVMAFAGGRLIRLLVKRLRGLSWQPNDEGEIGESLFSLYNLGLLFVATYALYLVSGEIRVMSAHLLLSLLMLIAFRRWKYAPVIAVAVFFLLFAPVFVDEFGFWQSEYAVDASQVQAGRAKIEEYVTYQPDASSPWCNTVILPVGMYDARVLYFPPGIGITYFLLDSYYLPLPDLKVPLKSRFVFTDETGRHALEAVNNSALNLRLLAKLPDGRLYYNKDTVCKGDEP